MEEDSMSFEPGLHFAQELDAADDLAMFREEFVLAEPDLIYMDGNSLGRLPHRTTGRLEHLVEEGWAGT
jgi:kynureninase